MIIGRETEVTVQAAIFRNDAGEWELVLSNPATKRQVTMDDNGAEIHAMLISESNQVRHKDLTGRGKFTELLRWLNSECEHERT